MDEQQQQQEQQQHELEPGRQQGAGSSSAPQMPKMSKDKVLELLRQIDTKEAGAALARAKEAPADDERFLEQLGPNALVGYWAAQPPAGIPLAPITARSDLLERFEALAGKKLTQTAQRKAFYECTAARLALQDRSMDPAMAALFYHQFQSRINSQSRQAVADVEGFILDGNLLVQGQPKSTLHVAFRGTRVFCAKVYNIEGAQGPASRASAADNEEAVSLDVHAAFECPTLVQVVKKVATLRHVIIIMPMLGRVSTDLCSYSGQSKVSDRACAAICMSVLSAVAALAARRWCHGDIKASNIMLPTDADDLAVLVDLASCTRYGEPLREFTPSHSLDMQPDQASLCWDLVCLASTLHIMSDEIRRVPSTVAELIELLTQRGSEASLGGQFSLVLLRNRGAAVQDLKSKVWMPCLEVVESRLGADVAGLLRARWPEAKPQLDQAAAEPAG